MKEELLEMLNKMKEELEDKDLGQSEAKELIDNAERVILVSTEQGCGFAGNITDVVSALCNINLKVLSAYKDDIDEKVIREMVEFIISIYKLDEEEQTKRLETRAKEAYNNLMNKLNDKTDTIKEKLEEMKSKTKSEDIKNRIEEIDKLLEEME